MLKESYSEFSRDNAMRLSAALSYYSLFSIAPLLMITVGIAGWVFGEKASQGEIVDKLSQFVGYQAAQSIQALLQNASKTSNAATIVGFITLLVGASTVFGQLKTSLNTIWKVQQKPGLGIKVFLEQELLTFGLVLTAGFLLIVSLLVTTIVAGLAGWLATMFGIPTAVSGSVGFVLPVLIEFFIFAAMFKVLPDAHVEWRSVWVGAAATAVLFEVAKIGLSFYLGRGSATSSFGAAGSLVVLLLWIYYASCILFFGAEFTQVYARRKGYSFAPTHIAERTEVWTPSGPVPAKCADVSNHEVKAALHEQQHGVRSPQAAGAPDAAGQHAGREPSKESLMPLLASDETPIWSPEVPVSSIEAPEGRGAVAQIGAALGVGVIAGVLLRIRETRDSGGRDGHSRR